MKQLTWLPAIAISAFSYCAGLITTYRVKSWTERTVVLNLMRAEAQAFQKVCKRAVDQNLLVSSDVSCLAALVAQGFTQDRARWTACKSPAAQDTVLNYYLNVAALPELF